MFTSGFVERVSKSCISPLVRVGTKVGKEISCSSDKRRKAKSSKVKSIYVHNWLKWVVNWEKSVSTR